MVPTKPKTEPISYKMHPFGTLLVSVFAFVMVLVGLSYIADSNGVEGFLTGVGAIAISIAVGKYFLGSSDSKEEFKSVEPKPSSDLTKPISDRNEFPSLHAYSLLMDELAKGCKDEVLWLKCASEAEGNEPKAQASYNRARAAALEMEEARLLKSKAEEERTRKRDLEEREKASLSQFMSEMKITVAAVRQSQPVFNTWGTAQLTKLASEVKSLMVKGEGLVGASQIESLRWADSEVSKALKSHEHDQLLLEQSKVALETRDNSAARTAMRQMQGRFKDLDYGPLEAVIEASDWRYTQITFGLVIIIIICAVCFLAAIRPEFTAVTSVSQKLSQSVTPSSPLRQTPPSVVTSEQVPAEEGIEDANVLFEMAQSYNQGDGVPQDLEKGFALMKKAAIKGLGAAQISLGLCYANGEGVGRDNLEAEKWWRKAADQGLAEAQHNLGVLYYGGDDGPKKLVEAEQWWLKAAAQGYAESQFNLGSMHEGEGSVEKDLKKAFEWYLKAAEQGLSEAQAALVEYYRAGLGIPQDKVEAYKWALLAASAEQEEYTELAKALEDELNAPQKQEAASRAYKFRLLHGSK